MNFFSPKNSESRSVVLWFDPNALSVISGVTTLMLANLPENHSVAYVWD